MRKILLLRFATLLCGFATAQTNQSALQVPEDSTRPALTSDQAADKLRAWLKPGTGLPRYFDTLASVTRALSEDELQALVDEVGLAEFRGKPGWIRSALHAEWGRRDPQAALAWVWDALGLPDRTAQTPEQACFAIFRGWSEAHPAAALRLLDEIGDENKRGKSPFPARLGGAWTHEARRVVFRNYALLDPQAAWEAASAHPFSEEALSGMFRGIRERATLEELAARWEPNWHRESALQDYHKFRRQLDARRPVLFKPGEEQIADAVAAAVSRFDFQAAWDWLGTAGPGDAKARRDRRQRLLDQWAGRYPDQAIAIIDQPNFREWQSPIAQIVMAVHPDRAAGLIAKLEDPTLRYEALLHAARAQQYLRSLDMVNLFPVPGLRTRLPDHGSRLRGYTTALQEGEFNKEQRRQILMALNQQFYGKTPAARTLLDQLKELGPPAP